MFHVTIPTSYVHPSIEKTGLGGLIELYAQTSGPFEFDLKRFFDGRVMTLEECQRATLFIGDLLRYICQNGNETQFMVRQLVVLQIYSILDEIFDFLTLDDVLDPYEVLILVEDELDDAYEVSSQEDDYPAFQEAPTDFEDDDEFFD